MKTLLWRWDLNEISKICRSVGFEKKKNECNCQQKNERDAMNTSCVVYPYLQGQWCSSYTTEVGSWKIGLSDMQGVLCNVISPYLSVYTETEANEVQTKIIQNKVLNKIEMFSKMTLFRFSKNGYQFLYLKLLDIFCKNWHFQCLAPFQLSYKKYRHMWLLHFLKKHFIICGYYINVYYKMQQIQTALEWIISESLELQENPFQHIL